MSVVLECIYAGFLFGQIALCMLGARKTQRAYTACMYDVMLAGVGVLDLPSRQPHGQLAGAYCASLAKVGFKLALFLIFSCVGGRRYCKYVSAHEHKDTHSHRSICFCEFLLCLFVYVCKCSQVCMEMVMATSCVCMRVCVRV